MLMVRLVLVSIYRLGEVASLTSDVCVGWRLLAHAGWGGLEE